jgi:proline racemase
MTSIFEDLNRQPPAHWTRISTIDLHTGGEPLRVIIGGLPPLEGRTVLEKRRFFKQQLDHLRTGLMFEPRGHADMYGAVLTSTNDPDADFDVFFLHNEGYSTMCGHAIIALTTLIQRASLTLNVPAGRIRANGLFKDGKLKAASFRNVPSFLYVRDQSVDVPGFGSVRFDIAYGGAFYAVVDVEQFEAARFTLTLTPEHHDRLIDAGRRIKRAVMANFSIAHPFEADLSFLYGTIFTGPAQTPGHHSRNVCVFADGEVDRSATGSGVSARAALHHAKGELALNEPITIESILGSTMSVALVATTRFGPHEAVIPKVTGTAHLTGRHEFFFDPEDPLGRGFIFR